MDTQRQRIPQNHQGEKSEGGPGVGMNLAAAAATRQLLVRVGSD